MNTEPIVNVDVEYFNNWVNGFYKVSGTPELEQAYRKILQMIPLILAGAENSPQMTLPGGQFPSNDKFLWRMMRIPVYLTSGFENIQSVCNYFENGKFSEIQASYSHYVPGNPTQQYRVLWNHNTGFIEFGERTPIGYGNYSNSYTKNTTPRIIGPFSSFPPIHPGLEYLSKFFKQIKAYQKLIQKALLKNAIHEIVLYETVQKITLNDEQYPIPFQGKPVQLPYPEYLLDDLDTTYAVGLVLHAIQTHTQICLESINGLDHNMMYNIESPFFAMIEANYVPIMIKCAQVLNIPITEEEIRMFVRPCKYQLSMGYNHLTAAPGGSASLQPNWLLIKDFTPDLFQPLDYSKSMNALMIANGRVWLQLDA
jgi:hypothetical protein